MAKRESAESAISEIRRKTQRRFSAEKKIRIVLEGLRGEVGAAMADRAKRRGRRAAGIRRIHARPSIGTIRESAVPTALRDARP